MKPALALVIGARPNFVKAAPLWRAYRRAGLAVRLVHTGQHYDAALSDAFLRDLKLPAPDVHLRVGSGPHGWQTGRIMERLEAELVARRPARLVVVGDVNSTMAAALVGAKLGIPVDHVEAGLRSGDRSMPEEVNRIVTDALADRMFTTEPAAVRNLRAEGRPAERIHVVGNVMIDSLQAMLPAARRRAAWRGPGLKPGGYGLVTLHRPSNVDDPARLTLLLGILSEVARRLPLAFPVHPRTAARLPRGLRVPGLVLLPPQPYVEFLSLLSAARLVITDSGGLQEESTFLHVPCLTLRDTTERPVTVELGTNTLVGDAPERLPGLCDRILAGRYKRGRIPRGWDGHAADRIARISAR